MAGLKLRAAVQIILTGLTLATAVTAVFFASVFGQRIDQMTENHRVNNMVSQRLPCIRSVLSACGGSKIDKCWDYCCPAGYFCERSAIVGLLCKDGSTTCGDYNWCRDFADIPNTCATDVCKQARMVRRTSQWSFGGCIASVFLDLVDIIVIFGLPDQVVLKSGVNIFSFLMKLVAILTVIGAGTQKFLSDMTEARCYNKEGMTMVENASVAFISYALAQTLSAFFSFILAPISAYYGGKLQGVPYVK
jgi:hypothetical protein